MAEAQKWSFPLTLPWVVASGKEMRIKKLENYWLLNSYDCGLQGYESMPLNVMNNNIKYFSDLELTPS